MEFYSKNNLQLIVRAHEYVMDGFEQYARGTWLPFSLQQIIADYK